MNYKRCRVVGSRRTESMKASIRACEWQYVVVSFISNIVQRLSKWVSFRPALRPAQCVPLCRRASAEATIARVLGSLFSSPQHVLRSRSLRWGCRRRRTRGIWRAVGGIQIPRCVDCGLEVSIRRRAVLLRTQRCRHDPR